MPNPVLSICIPTFNRAEFLKQCLESIVSQFKGDITAKVEVVISDNGSVDNTQKIAEDFCNKFSNIRFFKNAENIGFDKNVLSVVEKSKGEYCWLLGDDDTLFENSLLELVALLSTNKYSYFLVNAWGYDRQMQKPAVSRPNLLWERNLTFNSLKDFVKSIPSVQNTVGYFGGMSCQIFRRSIWVEMQNKQEFIGTQTVHLFIILNAFKDLPASILTKPMVKVRADNMRWNTFPGLESVKKRSVATMKTQEWIFKLYDIKYSSVFLKLNCYYQIIYSALLGFLRKTIFSSQRVRNFLKKILGI